MIFCELGACVPEKAGVIGIKVAVDVGDGIDVLLEVEVTIAVAVEVISFGD